MTFIADLHIHSKYSRATSRDCDLPNLTLWAQKKGIDVVGTGDFTHPAWRNELRERLLPEGDGLFTLKPDIVSRVQELVPKACQAKVRFLLSAEISTIYKDAGRTRKVHHVICVPSFEAADAIAQKLGKIGNIVSDGRPILGMRSRDLLEIVLESDPRSFLIPAHIWTPWFSALGSKSGYDSIDACYGDLASHIFAVETGLSSDPAMNWRVSSLDRFRLISSSDAHSPQKLGREAVCFQGECSFDGILRALRDGVGFGGTVEFFPEEGKYHADGHRDCGVCLSPEETRRLDARCPTCSKPVTVGVLNRVEALADRPEGSPPPKTAGEVRSLIPLAEILGEVYQCGPATKKVTQACERLFTEVGPELPLLGQTALEAVPKTLHPLFPEALRRLRAGQVIRQPGFDGEYGVIRLFAPFELAE